MLVLSHMPNAVCAATGLSAFRLAKHGLRLTVDRIDPALGYIQGNMQLLTCRLNEAKGVGLEVPAGAVATLLRQAERTTEDVHSAHPAPPKDLPDPYVW